MKKITKKLFNELHKKNYLLLIQSCSNKTPKQLIPLIENYKGEIPTIPTSKSDTGNQGNCVIIKIYTKVIIDRVFYFVHQIIDNSKNKDCSWNSIDNITILYILK